MQAPSNRAASLAHRGGAKGMDPRTAFGLFAAILFFLASGIIAYRNVTVLRDDMHMIVHSHQVIVALDALESSLQDAETGQRGYLLTGKEKYLDPYRAAIGDVDTRFRSIGSLTRDNPGQQMRLIPLRRHIDAKLAELKQTIDVRRSAGPADALTIVNSDRGKVEMDAVRAQLAVMQQAEVRLRQDRMVEMDLAYRSAWISGVMSCVLGILLTLVIGFLIRRAALATGRRQWLQQGQVDLSATMLGDKGTHQLGESALNFLVRFTGAQAGAVFAGQGDHFARAAVYGVPPMPELSNVSRFITGCLEKSQPMASLFCCLIYRTVISPLARLSDATSLAIC